MDCRSSPHVRPTELLAVRRLLVRGLTIRGEYFVSHFAIPDVFPRSLVAHFSNLVILSPFYYEKSNFVAKNSRYH